MKKSKQQIKQRITQKRGEVSKKRLRKFSHLKNTDNLGTYYLQKRGIKLKGKFKGNVRGLKQIQVPINSAIPGPPIPSTDLQPKEEKKSLISKVKSLFNKNSKSK